MNTYTLTEAAAETGISSWTISQLIKTEKIKARKKPGAAGKNGRYEIPAREVKRIQKLCGSKGKVPQGAIITVQDAAVLLRLAPATVMRLIHDKTIRAFVPMRGAKYKVSLNSVKEYAATLNDRRRGKTHTGTNGGGQPQPAPELPFNKTLARDMSAAMQPAPEPAATGNDKMKLLVCSVNEQTGTMITSLAERLGVNLTEVIEAAVSQFAAEVEWSL